MSDSNECAGVLWGIVAARCAADAERMANIGLFYGTQTGTLIGVAETIARYMNGSYS